MKKSYLIFTLLALLSACNSNDDRDCESLSMRTFRGFPRDAHKFQKHCKDKPVYYTQELCKKALRKLILSSSEKELKKEFGERVMECFNQSDIEKFLKK